MTTLARTRTLRDGETQDRRYVEFHDGKSAISAVLDETVFSVVQRVSYQGLEQPAALAYTADHPLLRDAARVRLFEKTLATYGGEPQVVMPQVPERSWLDPLDAILAVPLLPDAAAVAARSVLLLVRTNDTLRMARDLLLSFAVPFHLGLFKLPQGEELFALQADLERPGGAFILDTLRERRDVTLLSRVFRQSTPSVSLYVESGYRHPHAALLERLTPRFADFEHLVCTRDERLRVTAPPESMISYLDAVPTLPPGELALPVRATAQDSRRLLDGLSAAGIDRIEVRIERRVSKSGGRGTASLDAEAAMLRLELLNLSERLQEFDRLAGRVPVIYGYCGDDVQPVRELFRSLPHSIKERLLCTAIERSDDSTPWLFLLPASPKDVVRLPTESARWIRFIGQSDALNPIPAVYIPEGYQLSPSLAAIGARRFAQVLSGSEDLEVGVWRLLLRGAPPQPAWRQLVLHELACRPLLQGLSTLAHGDWTPLLASFSAAPKSAPERWTGSFDEYERELITQVEARLEKLEARIRDLLPRAGKLVEALVARSESLAALEGFNQKMEGHWDAQWREQLTQLEQIMRNFSSRHKVLAARIEEALKRSRRTEQLADAAEPDAAAGGTDVDG